MTPTLIEKALEQMTMERDAAIVAKEDVLGQLRVMKRRLKEAEEEQYKAEEDAATLRAEMQTLQQADQGHVTYSSYTPDQQEIAAVKSELEEMWQRLQQEQEKVAWERQRNASLASKIKDLEIAKQDCEKALTVSRVQSEQDDITSASITLPLTVTSPYEDTGTSTDTWATSLLKDENEKLKLEKSKHENQLRELASMVERLEKGRQTLLGEIDAQSQEIERLFVVNSNLEITANESLKMSQIWQEHVKKLSETNEQLREEINRIRMECALSASEQPVSQQALSTNDQSQSEHHTTETRLLEGLKRDNINLKVKLAEMQAQLEKQTAEVAQLSANLNSARLISHSLARTYKPVLANIENRLLQLKQDSHNSTNLFLAY